MNENTPLDIRAIVEGMQSLVGAYGETIFTLKLHDRMDVRDWERGPLYCRNFPVDVKIDFESSDCSSLSIDRSDENDDSVISLGLPTGSRVVLSEYHCFLRDRNEVVVCKRTHWYPAPEALIDSFRKNIGAALEEMEQSDFVSLHNVVGHLLLRFDGRFWSQCK